MVTNQLSNNLDSLNEKIYYIDSEKANVENMNNNLMVEVDKKSGQIEQLKIELTNLDYEL